ncbi:hypothetical protein B0H17DRAFT_1191903 [Mycena rosella]|uniref:Transmembrane protein n=1 Tax=Mycena rosella TaxID=1033263 RepID=A0AAD7GXI4_MYCRO|nr:hypothetical protein B0H17DRAFT_1191903 [Mycena rosella]
MSSASEQAELETELLQFIADTQTTNYLLAASLTLAVFEHMATFKDEAEAITCSFIVVTADIILVMRVWVLYGRAKKLLYFFLPLIIVEIIAMLIVAVLTILPLRDYFHIGTTILGCYSLRVPRYLTFYAIPPAVTTFIAFGMTIYKCGLSLFDNSGAYMPVITLFFRDGVFWFLAMFAISFTDLLVWARGRPGLAQATIAPATVLVSVIGSRILLNLKRVAMGGSVNDTTAPTVELESLAVGRIEFARQPSTLRTEDTRDV